MLRERVADDIYVFTSDLYVKVTAGVIFTSQGVVVIDTLLFPQETSELVDLVRRKAKNEVCYVINTHSHSDHLYGTYLFGGAEVIGHELCRQALQKHGEEDLDEAKGRIPDLAEVQLCLPSVTFNEELILRLGNKTLRLMHTPGATPDSIVVYVKEDKVLFAGDTVMPVPYIVDGDRLELRESLRAISKLSLLDNIVQGHGGVLLRGEVKETLRSSIAYLDIIYEKVQEKIEAGAPRDELRRIDIESCGKSRIPLDGLVQDLHQANLESLYDQLISGER
jgi:glyoxylase-like metal-dependent hydrolase (beta-lactamase superfamily II)